MQASVGRAPQLVEGTAWAVLAAAGGILVAGLASLSFAGPPSYRLLLAVLIACCLLLLAVHKPRAAILATFVFLVVMALLRRLLIPVAGWASYDPLLLVGPVVVTFLLIRIIWVSGYAALTADRQSVLVVAILVLSGLQSVNPAGGGAVAGLTGVLFGAIPLLWYFAGRHLGDRRTAAILVGGILVMGPVVALYGIWQAGAGLPPWDASWFVLNGYDALRVGEALHPFANFSSGAEYVAFVAFTLMAAAALLFHRHPAAFAAVPLPAWALVEGSIRTFMALAIIGLVAMAALRVRRARVGVAVLVIGAAGVASAVVAFGDALETRAMQTANPLVIHQVSGLVHPTDSSSSTLGLHQGLVQDGFLRSIQHPLGLGTAYLAGDKFASPAVGTEVDISNEFVALGPLGGLLYLALVIVSFIKVAGLYRRRLDPVLLAVAGMLIADFGQWLNGGFYAVAAIVWFVIGWIAREAAQPVTAAAVAAPRPVVRPGAAQRPVRGSADFA
jgi:hypothetical protein